MKPKESFYGKLFRGKERQILCRVKVKKLRRSSFKKCFKKKNRTGKADS